MIRTWSADDLLLLSRTYQGACIFAAAADLGVFETLARGVLTADDLARELRCNARAITVLLDALGAMGVLDKREGRYALTASARPYLDPASPSCVLPMVLHQANCMRRWAQLSFVVKSGKPAERTPSVRGEDADTESFIGGMHVLAGPVADDVVRSLAPLSFRHLLDVGGGPGTWTMAFLRAVPGATATLFDLPDVIPLAERRFAEAGMSGRVRLAAGDYEKDPLPAGADFAWVSAIIHSLGRRENRRLYASIYGALAPGGTIAVRDVVMNPDRTTPPMGALFAVNMLVGTEEGGTYTLDEIREDLGSAGFTAVEHVRRDDGMHSIVTARRPV